MKAPDALDVIHVFFEEDLLDESKEAMEAKTRVRKMIYRQLYKKTYKYGVASSDQSYNYSTASDGYLGEEDDAIEEPVKFAKKDYIPPTEINPNSSNPFGKSVEPPLG